MMRLLAVILCIFVTFSAPARVFTSAELQVLNSNELFQKSIRNYVDIYISNTETGDFKKTLNENVDNEWLNDAKRYAILQYIAQHPKSDKHKQTLNALRSYKSMAYKMHEEGHMQLPVFDFVARIKGIENIWSSEEIRMKSYKLFQLKSQKALDLIDEVYQSDHLGNIYGVKSSLKMLDDETLRFWSDLLIQEFPKSLSLQRFAMDFAVSVKDRYVTRQIMSQSLLSVKIEMLRNLSVFNEEFRLSVLMESSNDPKLSKMSLSLLKPYVNQDLTVRNHLFNKLREGSNVHSIAFALSDLHQYKDLSEMKSIYFLTPQNKIKNAILSSLRQNPNSEAKVILQELIVNGEQK